MLVYKQESREKAGKLTPEHPRTEGGSLPPRDAPSRAVSFGTKSPWRQQEVVSPKSTRNTPRCRFAQRSSRRDHALPPGDVKEGDRTPTNGPFPSFFRLSSTKRAPRPVKPVAQRDRSEPRLDDRTLPRRPAPFTASKPQKGSSWRPNTADSRTVSMSESPADLNPLNLELEVVFAARAGG